ncbi:HNH endonuclease signature motif containing protein [Brevibacillus sp. FIR094]|uniref:HNH endonuclease signature motif containing protein n=1 Tax=Brevibacillus sp. FIR094 TaxID=3134809 RepID=UPI003D1AE405
MKKYLLSLLAFAVLLISPSGAYAEDSTDNIEERIERGELKELSSTTYEIFYDSTGEILSTKEVNAKHLEAIEELEVEIGEELDKDFDLSSEQDHEEMPVEENTDKEITEENQILNRADSVRIESGLLIDESNREIVSFAKIDRIRGAAPIAISGKVTLQTSTNRNKRYSDEDSFNYTFTGVEIRVNKRKTSEPVSIVDTNFWRTTNSTVSTWSNGYSDSDYDVGKEFLLNKKGIEYPKYRDSHSRIKMFEPDEADLSWVPNNQREPRESGMRGLYIDWYENKYGTPDFSWDDVDIHHIIPLAYGGDNSYDNLIPLPKDFHRKDVTPWWASYGKYVPSGDDY